MTCKIAPAILHVSVYAPSREVYCSADCMSDLRMELMHGDALMHVYMGTLSTLSQQALQLCEGVSPM